MVTWNIQGKANLHNVEVLDKPRWSMLALQEASKKFTADGHVMKTTREMVDTVLVAHRRLAARVVCLSGIETAWVAIGFDNRSTYPALHFSLVIYPTNGGSLEKWEQAIRALYKDIQDALWLRD